MRTYTEWRQAVKENVTELANELRQCWDTWKHDPECVYATWEECLQAELSMSAAQLRDRNYYARKKERLNSDGTETQTGTNRTTPKVTIEQLAEQRGVSTEAIEEDFKKYDELSYKDEFSRVLGELTKFLMYNYDKLEELERKVTFDDFAIQSLMLCCNYLQRHDELLARMLETSQFDPSVLLEEQ